MQNYTMLFTINKIYFFDLMINERFLKRLEKEKILLKEENYEILKFEIKENN